MQIAHPFYNIMSIVCPDRGCKLKSYLFALKCTFFAWLFLQTDLTLCMWLYFSTHLVFRKYERLFSTKRAKISIMIFIYEFFQNIFRVLLEMLWCKESVFSGYNFMQRTSILG